VWHFVHGWPVLFAIFGFAIAGRDVALTIAKMIKIAAAIPAVANTIVWPIVFFFGIEYSLGMHPLFPGVFS